MEYTITSEVVEAYSLCPRKAFLLLRGGIETVPHEYASLIEEQEVENRKAHRNRLLETAHAVAGPLDPTGGRQILVDGVLSANGLEARYDAVRWARKTGTPGKKGYEPAKVVGTHRVTQSQVIGLAYLGYVLGQMQHHFPSAGTIVRAGGQACRITLTEKYPEVRSIVGILKTWTEDISGECPPVVLNKHCPSCPFRAPCHLQAEKEDNLSLLDRMSPQLMQKYHAKGIFTVNQLAYLFRPRRTKQRGRRPVRHDLELQALALKTGKTYIEHLPDLSRGAVELFVDVEGVPDRGSYYLIGLLVCAHGDTEYHSFWANSVEEEERIWENFLDRVTVFPDAPLYHYGNYERKAFESLAKRCGKGRELVKRLVNVASSIYGRVYFPVRSNGLKTLGSFLGARWTAPEASGLQSLVWRHQWETTGADHCMQALLQYNREDCEALCLLAAALSNIKERADSDPTVDFAQSPKPNATANGSVAHRQFEEILKYAEAGSGKKTRHLRLKETEQQTDGPKKKGAPKGHQAFQRIIATKVGRIVHVASKRRCARHGVHLVSDTGEAVEKTVIDLVFTRNGCRKTITRYVGRKAYCPKCTCHYNPPSFERVYRSPFGHGFQAWTVYQRVILRLPYDIITQVMEHLFAVGMSKATVVNFLRYMAGYYKPTENAILQVMLKSAFIHVDETRINVQGVDHYVWVFTDGRHVFFRMTETREADVVHQVLSGYEGILVSDFYPGYDSVPCRQQKCLVHLIGDLNDDLWKAPFDREFEAFALDVRTLLVPIIDTIDKHGLKTWHLRKFEKSVERFYARSIVGREYASEQTAKYKKRFQRHRESLFRFLGQDDIPWNNNMAERAIRQLAIQRKISGTFFKKVAPQYLLLLAIAQTCRFQEKSFLKFLLSKERDVDQFRRCRPVRYSAPVGPTRGPNFDAPSR